MKSELEKQVIRFKQNHNLKKETTGVIVLAVQYSLYGWVVTLQLPFLDISMRDLNDWVKEVYTRFPFDEDGLVRHLIAGSIEDIGSESYDYVSETDRRVQNFEEFLEWNIKYLGRDKINRSSPYLILQLSLKIGKKCDTHMNLSKAFVENYLAAMR